VSLAVRPITQRAARAWVTEHHRHLGARLPAGDVIRAAAYDGERMVGVAFAGRPVARHLDDGATLEILRVAVLPDARNACSLLYGALRRAGIALGWSRFVTYTLPSEGGGLAARLRLARGHHHQRRRVEPAEPRAPACPRRGSENALDLPVIAW
jgi:hypothetical protein